MAKSQLCLSMACLLACSSPAWGIVIRHDRLDAQYLAHGSQFPEAGLLTLTPSAGDAFLCTGVLIAPQWALTAAHCIDEPLSGQTFFIGGSEYLIDQRVPHPNWTGSGTEGYDIGLVHLSTPVTNVTPAVLYDASDEVGQTAATVGFGLTGNGLTGAAVFDGMKRAADNVLDVTGGQIATTGAGAPLNLSAYSERIIFADFDNPLLPVDSAMGGAAPLDLEGLPTAGDSGGGAMFLNSGGQNAVSGVLSFIASVDPLANSDYGDYAGYTRVSPFVDWIESRIPEPPSAGLIMLGAVFAFSSRRYVTRRSLS